MRFIGIVILPLVLATCASNQQWRQLAHSPEPAAAIQDSLSRPPEVSVDKTEEILRAARAHLRAADQASSNHLFSQAQAELDEVFELLAALEEADVNPQARAAAEAIGADAEDIYMLVLPHVRGFSSDSPLTLLLRGLPKANSKGKWSGERAAIERLRPACDVPIDNNDRVVSKVRYLRGEGRDTYAVWLARSVKYDSLIRRTLRANGLPEDLFFVAMIESGFDPRAQSKAKAVGMWQFIPSTGQMEGLKTGRRHDERHDPVKSTQAAARHLKRLYGELGDWRLALAAYNAGLGRVEQAIARAGSRDFWRLDLPEETENYVPLFMAAVVLSKDPHLLQTP